MTEEVSAIVADALEHAKSAGLRYVNVTHLERGVRRLKSGKGFRYVSPDGKTIRDEAELTRLRKLAIPPAWTDVWISPSPLGHIQEHGRVAVDLDPRQREIERNQRESGNASCAGEPALRVGRKNKRARAVRSKRSDRLTRRLSNRGHGS